MAELRLILAAVESPLGDAWERFCGDVPFVTIHRGSILEVETEAVVSPANSFGFKWIAASTPHIWTTSSARFMSG